MFHETRRAQFSGVAFLFLATLFCVAPICLFAKANKPWSGGSHLCDGSGLQTTTADRTFFKALQKAVRNRNIEMLANHIDYPLRLITPKTRLLLVEDAQGLNTYWKEIFPPMVVKALVTTKDSSIKRTREGVVIGDTGIIALPVPEPGKEKELHYFICHVKYSAPPQTKVVADYRITWTDKVFLIQLKQALTHRNYRWLASKIETPFTLCKYLAGKNPQVDNKWLLAHQKLIWFTKLRNLITPKNQSYVTKKYLDSTRAQNILSFATMDLWRNWKGLMVNNGFVWIDYYHEGDDHCRTYWIQCMPGIGCHEEEWHGP